MHACRQKRGVPEEAKIGRTITTFLFSTRALGAPRSADPRDAVSAAESLCTHVKDHPGLGAPNSLKLTTTYYYCYCYCFCYCYRYCYCYYYYQ